MKNISSIMINGSNAPSEEIPDTALRVIFDGGTNIYKVAETPQDVIDLLGQFPIVEATVMLQEGA